MKKIGQSFSDELKAAGLVGLPFAWDCETGAVRMDDPRLTDAQRDAIKAVRAAHNPTTLSAVQITENTKTQALTDLVSHCTLIEADASLPIKVKALAMLLKKVLQP